MGKVTGNITTAEAINIRETATVDGDLVAPKIGIAEGASFRGKIDMRPSKAPTGSVEVKSQARDAQAPSSRQAVA